MWYLLGDPPEFHVGEFADVHEDGHGDDSAGRRGRHAQVLVQVRVVTQNLDLEGQYVRLLYIGIIPGGLVYLFKRSKNVVLVHFVVRACSFLLKLLFGRSSNC